ncbi:MAG: hypothetical protein U9R27_00980 [Campylobacterota bacterium]|nr:hypothetical protein [Campylobacterota bacterium]
MNGKGVAAARCTTTKWLGVRKGPAYALNGLNAAIAKFATVQIEGNREATDPYF